MNDAHFFAAFFSSVLIQGSELHNHVISTDYTKLLQTPLGKAILHGIKARNALLQWLSWCDEQQI